MGVPVAGVAGAGVAVSHMSISRARLSAASCSSASCGGPFGCLVDGGVADGPDEAEAQKERASLAAGDGRVAWIARDAQARLG